MERECRDGINPFEMNGYTLADQTSLRAGELARRLHAAGIELPEVPNADEVNRNLRAIGLEPPEDLGDDEDDYIEFIEWWSDHADDLTEEQRNIVWDLCDRARFYDIVETEVEVEE